MSEKRKYISGFIAGLSVICILLSACGKSDELYEEAKDLFIAESYTESCEKVKLAIEENGDKADYYILYGMALIGCADYENAREQFLYVVQNKDNKMSREINKQAYRGIALTYYESGVYDQAKAYFELALETDALSDMDNDLMAYCAECELYLGDHSEAIKLFSKLIDSKELEKDEIVGCYVGRANAYMILGEYMKAAEDYQQAIEKNKACYPAYIGKYLALVNTHDETAASEFLQEAIETVQKKEDASYYLAMFEYYNGNDDTALELFSAEKENGNNEANYYIGLINQRKGLYQEALICFDEYITAVPSGKNAEYCNQVAGCYMALEDYEKATEYLESGVLLAGGNMKQELQRNRIIAYEKVGDYNKALEYAEEYIEQYDDSDMINEYKFIQTRCKEKEPEE